MNWTNVSYLLIYVMIVSSLVISTLAYTQQFRSPTYKAASAVSFMKKVTNLVTTDQKNVIPKKN